jgi:hypothetical protein
MSAGAAAHVALSSLDDDAWGDLSEQLSRAKSRLMLGPAGQDLSPSTSGEEKMKKRITSVDPWQCAKTFALMYFALGIVLAIPIGLITRVAPLGPGQERPSLVLILCLPILYAIAALIFVPIGCWIYNKCAGFTGGIELTLEPDA